jgi:hypothetical protein
MKRGTHAFVVFGAGLVALTLAAGAGGTTTRNPTKVRYVRSRIEALAIDGNRIAYDVGSTLGKNNNKVLVWNVRTGKTTTVSGKRTRTVDGSSTGSGVFQLALAGTHVAWLANVGGNTEGDDYLFSSSATKPKERKLASEQRYGENCAGRSQPNCAGGWLGGLAGSGSLMAFNAWTTDDSGAVAGGSLVLLNGTEIKPIATGADTVLAAAADKGRVAVLRPDGTIGLYSSSGALLRTVTPTSAASVALSGHNLVVLTKTRQLELYYAPSGSLSKTFSVQGRQTPGNLDVQGEIAIYSVGASVHALNLGNGKDRVIGKLSRSIGLAHIGSAGVVYSNTRYASKGTLVFVPLARVTAAVGR